MTPPDRAQTATVLFVCQHGAAKSVVAAALCRRLAGEAGLALEGVARGTEPEPEVASAAAAGLHAEGIDVGDQRPREVSREDVRAAWRVVTFGPEVPGSDSPGVVVERWADVPAVSEDYPAARDAIAGRLRSLMVAAAVDPAVPRT
jgi:arsenate reductase (thioredoxin)